jgi:hypothetical protein
VTMLGPIARLALLGGSVCCAALTAFIAVRSSRYTPQGAAIVIGTLLAATVVLGYAAFRMRVPTRFRIVRELAMVLVALLAVEFMIAVVAPPTPSRQMERMRAAERIGRPFDARTKSQVVSNLQEQGQDALPGLSRDWPRMGAVRQQLPDGLFPLGHASHAHIVAGSWLPAKSMSRSSASRSRSATACRPSAIWPRSSVRPIRAP